MGLQLILSAILPKSVTPGQQVIKIVHDTLIETLKGEGESDDLKIDNPPAPILMVGLQRSRENNNYWKIGQTSC